MTEIDPGAAARLVAKIATRTSWDQARRSGSFIGSADDLRDGYIHLSTLEQLRETARRHFKGQNDLVLIALDSQRLQAHLKWEASRGGALFPHYYGALPVDAAVWVRALRLNGDGIPNIDLALADEGLE